MFIINYRDRFKNYSVQAPNREIALAIFDAVINDTSFVFCVVVDPEGRVVKYFTY